MHGSCIALSEMYTNTFKRKSSKLKESFSLESFPPLGPWEPLCARRRRRRGWNGTSLGQQHTAVVHTHTHAHACLLSTQLGVCVCGPPFLLVGVDRAQAMQKDEMTAAHEALPSFLLAFEGGSLSTPGKKVAHAATWMHNDAMWREGSAAHVRGELKQK